jgi:predicted cupin superfamily sugar epimerase
MPTAQQIIAALRLQPHPIEGGYFRETYRASGSVRSSDLPHLPGATMAPGFDCADYEQGRRADLLAQYPSHAELINRLTRQ